MKIIEKIIGVIALLGIVLKLLSVPGGAILTVFSLMALSMVYCFLGFVLFNNIKLLNIFKKESYEGISPKKIIGTVGLGWALSETLFGILFKIMRYVGSLNMLIMGLSFILIIAVIALIPYRKNKTSFYKGIFIRIIIIGGLGLIALMF